MNFSRDKSSYEEIESGTSPLQIQKSKLAKYGAPIFVVGIVCTLAVVLLPPSSNTSSDIEKTSLQASDTSVPNSAVQTGEDKNEEDLLVEIDKGTVRGIKLTTRLGREYLGFRGIPYGKAPSGERRFQPPEENEPWEGVLNATQFAEECLQSSKADPVGLKGEEDCLKVNVYTPKKYAELGKRKYLPVMVYLHGGMAGGSSNRNGGDYMLDEDIVLVGINYRVGVLGNLNTNDSLARGNQGLRDQILGLQWIQDNIRYFGGDKRKVTLFGNSYGAMAIATHLLSPMTKGLFHQFICQSGEALFPNLLQRTPLENAFKLGESLQCNATTTVELMDCFQSRDPRDLIIASYDVKMSEENIFSMTRNVFTTSVDPKLEDIAEDDVYLPDLPLKLIQNGKTMGMPAIIGVNSGEGLFNAVLILEMKPLTKAANENWETFAPAFLDLGKGEPQINFVNSAKDFYFGSQNISIEVRDNLTNLFSDRLGIHPAHVHAVHQKQANRRRENVYLYYFTKEVESSYMPPFGSIDAEERRKLGPTHADEVQFLFTYEKFPVIPKDSKNAKFSQMMVRLWATFAKSGKPGSGDNNVEWLPIKEQPYHWFRLDEEPEMVNFLGERMKFWDSFEMSDIYG